MNSRIQKINLKKLCTFIIVFFVGFSYAQSVKKMQGKVVDPNGTPLLGVTVSLEGTEIGTMTELDGSYTISSDKPSLTVEFSYIGSKTKTLPFKNGTYDVILEDSVESLNAVNVISTGYQKLKVNEVAGAVESVQMKDFQKRIAGGGNNIITTLEGLSTAITAASTPGQEGNKQMIIRGISTLQANSSPLIVLDGFPYSGDINSINSYDIDTITVLRDAAAASIYGAQSANGVIVITTKRAKSGRLRFGYSTNVELRTKSDIEYKLNRVDSKYLVKLQKDYFKTANSKNSAQTYFESYQSNEQGSGSKNKVLYLMLENHEGRLSDTALNNTLNQFSETDNMEDLKRLVLQMPIYTEHNFSIEYGEKGMKMRTSLNYFTNESSIKGEKDQGVKYSLNSLINISDKFRLDLTGRFNIGERNSYKSDYGDILNTSPYEKIWDNNGNPLAVTKGRTNGIEWGGKDPFEIERLKGLGLFDETYKPGFDYGLSTKENNNWGAGFNAQATLNIAEGLNINGGFNINKQNRTNRIITDANSWQMKAIQNNTTLEKKDDNGKLVKGELLLPLGDMILENKIQSSNYLLRGQLIYDKTFNQKHKVLALLGTEIRASKSTSTSIERLGYDKKSNTFNKYLDYNKLANTTKGTFHPRESQGGFDLDFTDVFSEIENRYFSLYGNTTYIYDKKYVAHASVRLDQSNLFGTDPEFRYRPFWSGSLKYIIDKEEFFKNDIVKKLQLQVSYGTNGNISNDSGPFDIARFKPASRYDRINSLVINSPKVNDLRWEATKTFNFGLRTNIIDKFEFTIDFYNKHTKDVFAYANIDPTVGFGTIKKNGATILNQGLEVTLNSINIQTENFRWSTYIGVSSNKSIVEEIAPDTRYQAYQNVGDVTNKKGYSPNSIFVTKWGGVNDEGYAILKGKNDKEMVLDPQGWDKSSGTWVYTGPGFNVTTIEEEDLVYAGTTVPSITGRMTNNFSYKNLDLSFMLIYQGGQTLIKDSYYGENVYAGVGNVTKDVKHAWENPGDEKKVGVLPKVGSDGGYNSRIVKFSDKNLLDGDYIRLRDVVLSYRLPESALKSNFLKNVVFNIRGKNLYLWTKNKEGIDPEAHGLGFRYLPINQSLSMGVNITF